MAFILTYRVNELLDGWANFAQGINLIFLPAGVKHLAILLAGKWGALGCLIALFMLSREFWNGLPAEQLIIYSTISTASTWLGIVLSLKMLGISKDLSNLKFMQLPVIDLITTGLHSFTTNVFFILAGIKTENFMENALAMMFGDYVGSFTVLMLLWLGLILLKRLNAPARNP